MKKVSKVLIVSLIIISLLMVIYIFVTLRNKKVNITSSENDNYLKNITLVVKEDTITPTGATFILTYKEDVLHSYNDDDYIIEVNKNGKWTRQLAVSDYLVTMSPTIPSNKTMEIQKNWTKRYGKLQEGYYRLGIKIQSEYVYANFTIK